MTAIDKRYGRGPCSLLENSLEGTYIDAGKRIPFFLKKCKGRPPQRNCRILCIQSRVLGTDLHP